MKVLVTGASGYIGNAVAAAFARAGHDVYGLIRRAEVADSLRMAEIQPVMGTLQEPASFVEVAARCSVIVHAAIDYQADARALDRETVEALLAVADRGPGPKTMVYTSGAWIYGDTAGEPVDETTPLDPTGVIRTRAEIERLVLDGQGIRGLVVRPGCVYGGRGGLTGLWFEGVEKGELKIVGEGKNHWSTVHVADLADAYLRVAESGLAGEIFNVADPSRVTVNEMADAIARTAGSNVTVTHVPLPEAGRHLGQLAESLALDQNLDARKITRQLGWVARHQGFPENARSCYEAWKASR